MTMPSDAADAVEANGSNEGPRDHEGVDTDHAAYVDEDNVPPHPPRGTPTRPAIRTPRPGPYRRPCRVRRRS